MNERVERADDPLIGQTLRDCYRVIRRIGEGGMGAVYEAEHTRIGRRVAIKRLHAQHAQNADIVRRFHREAQAAARIGNEHIVEVTDMGELPDGSPFFVLELLTGQSLSELVQKGPLPIGRAVYIAQQICDALEAAHVAGIVHRDLKPENVFLMRKPRDPDFVKVLDFGISRFREAAERIGGASTAAGSTLGTPYYMSPEQAHGLKDIDARVDVWAMGVILYQLLTGRLPFEAETYPLLVLKIVSEHPSPIAAFRDDVPAELDAIVSRAIAKPRDERFPSMATLSAALTPFRAIETVPAMRVPSSGASLGGASSTPSLGGMSAFGDSGRGALSGSGARPSFGVMPTPPPTSSRASTPPIGGVAGRTVFALFGVGLVLAALIGTGTFALLSSRMSASSETTGPRVTATRPVATPAPAVGGPVAPPPAAAAVVPVPAVAPSPAPPPAVVATPAPAPAVTTPPTTPPTPTPPPSTPTPAPVVVAQTPPVTPAQPTRTTEPPSPRSRRDRGRTWVQPTSPAITPVAARPAPIVAPPRPVTPAPTPRAAPVAAPRPAPPPAPARTRPPVYVGPSRSDTTGLRPDPY